MNATPDMWHESIEGETRDGFGFVLKGCTNDLVYQSVTAPDSLDVYHEAVSEFGTMDWRDICAPAFFGYGPPDLFPRRNKPHMPKSSTNTAMR